MFKRARVIVLLCVFLLSACKQPVKEEGVGNQQDQDEIQIGMSFDSFVIERWQRDRDVFVSKAKELGATVNVQNANGEIKEQISQIEYFIEKKMDVIVVICIDSDGLTQVLKKAKSEGIKVVCYDRMVHSADVDLYISFDNVRVGELMGEGLVNGEKKSQRVLMICGPTTDDNVAQVVSGFERVMKENNVEIVETHYVESWKAELAADYVYRNMDKIAQVDGIMCGNDSLATQCIRALAEKRKAGSIQVVGQDADLEGCQRIVEGTQVLTVYKPVEVLAKTAAEYAVKLAQGESLSDLETISDVTYEVPSIVIEPVGVTQSNLDEVIIKSGYHLKEDVYLNMD